MEDKTTPQIQYADRKKKNELIGSGCLLQLVGFIFPFVLGAVAGIPGVIAGILLLLVCLIAGSRMSVKWICGNCNNPLANKSIKVCPACNAHLERIDSISPSTTPQPWGDLVTCDGCQIPYQSSVLKKLNNKNYCPTCYDHVSSKIKPDN